MNGRCLRAGLFLFVNVNNGVLTEYRTIDFNGELNGAIKKKIAYRTSANRVPVP